MGQYDAHRNNCSLSGSITRQAGNMKYNLSLAASGQDEVVAVGGGLTSFALDTQTNTLYGAAQDDGKGLTFISFDVTSRTSTVKALHGRTFTFTLALTLTLTLTPTPTVTLTLTCVLTPIPHHPHVYSHSHPPSLFQGWIAWLGLGVDLATALNETGSSIAGAAVLNSLCLPLRCVCVFVCLRLCHIKVFVCVYRCIVSV